MVRLSNIKSMAVAAVLLVSSTQAIPIPRFRSIIEPKKLPACSTDGDRKWQPAMDFDQDSCYNIAAIGVKGELSPGLNNCYSTGPAHCRDPKHLDNSNVYARARCNNGWCAHMYGYFFEKDTNLEHICGVGAGHRYDWEHVVVWVQNDVAKYVAVSAHGNYIVRPIEHVLMDNGTHPKVVYHRAGAQTHSFLFAHKDDDAIENHKGTWFYGDLVSYQGFPSTKIRETMFYHNWGAANADLRNELMPPSLEFAKGGYDIPLNVTFSERISSGVPECAIPTMNVRIGHSGNEESH